MLGQLMILKKSQHAVMSWNSPQIRNLYTSNLEMTLVDLVLLVLHIIKIFKNHEQMKGKSTIQNFLQSIMTFFMTILNAAAFGHPLVEKYGTYTAKLRLKYDYP
jgi:hypothetical protein